MKLKITLTALLLCLCLLLVSCGASNDKPEETAGAKTENETKAPNLTEAPVVTDVPETEAPETEPEVERPTADGQEVAAYDISFYLPDFLTPNEYNGMLGVYDYYTGEYVGVYPSGIDVALSVLAESNTNGDLEGYAKDSLVSRYKASVEPEKVDFNGHEWLRFKVDDGNIYYCTTFNDGLYEIYTRIGGESAENFNAVISMMEQTLFLAVTDW